jgi:hypothetical protein
MIEAVSGISWATSFGRMKGIPFLEKDTGTSSENDIVVSFSAESIRA